MTIKSELEALHLEYGPLLQAVSVVEWAKDNPTSALYSALEWDNEKASHQYRLWQVRKLVQIHLVDSDYRPQVISLSIDRVKPKGGYRNLDVVMQSRILRDVALSDALMELQRVRSKYEWLSELAGVWQSIDRIRQKRRPGDNDQDQAGQAG